jgi:hypothetical protein
VADDARFESGIRNTIVRKAGVPDVTTPVLTMASSASRVTRSHFI